MGDLCVLIIPAALFFYQQPVSPLLDLSILSLFLQCSFSFIGYIVADGMMWCHFSGM
jgi:hypothetical protein